MQHESNRREAIACLAAIVGTLAIPTASALGEAPPVRDAGPGRRAVELTFLLSKPGDRERLRQFIVLNWFAMDAIAKERGLMRAYTVMDTGTDEGEWNVLVAVTYADARGYEGIAAEFETIRRAHRVIPVDGRTLRELGSIVKTTRVYE